MAHAVTEDHCTSILSCLLVQTGWTERADLHLICSRKTSALLFSCDSVVKLEINFCLANSVKHCTYSPLSQSLVLRLVVPCQVVKDERSQISVKLDLTRLAERCNEENMGQEHASGTLHM